VTGATSATIARSPAPRGAETQEGWLSPRRRNGPTRARLRRSEWDVTPVIARTRPREERSGSRTHRGGRQTLEGRNPGEDRVRTTANPGGQDNGLPEGSTPGSRARPRGTTASRLSRRHAGRGAPKRERRSPEGKASEGRNPMSVTGMRQDRRAPGGSNRQEGAKPWRRTGRMW
jgi:hypothetical protein